VYNRLEVRLTLKPLEPLSYTDYSTKQFLFNLGFIMWKHSRCYLAIDINKISLDISDMHTYYATKDYSPGDYMLCKNGVTMQSIIIYTYKPELSAIVQ